MINGAQVSIITLTIMYKTPIKIIRYRFTNGDIKTAWLKLTFCSRKKFSFSQIKSSMNNMKIKYYFSRSSVLMLKNNHVACKTNYYWIRKWRHMPSKFINTCLIGETNFDFVPQEVYKTNDFSQYPCMYHLLRFLKVTLNYVAID